MHSLPDPLTDRPRGVLLFHLLLEGEAVVEVEGERHPLGVGDLLLVPHGTGHRILSSPDAPARSLWDVEREVVSERYEHLVIDGGGAPATLACGAVSFADPGVGRLLASLQAALPATPEDDDADAEWLRAAVAAIGREAHRPRPGSDVVAALRDPTLGPVLRAVHADPGRAWTLESLAREASTSRTVLAERFAAVVGEPPMTYVAGWRLDVAVRLLREPGASVAAVAHRVGYGSLPGFHRAFVRRHGTTPGAWQRAAPDPLTEATHLAETIPG